MGRRRWRCDFNADHSDTLLEHRDWLDGRIVLEATAAVGVEGRAPATAFSELDVVDVRSGSFLEQREEFILGAVETVHAGVILRPDDHVERLEAQLRRFDGALRRGSANEVVQPSCR